MWPLNAEAVNINIHKLHKANGKKVMGGGNKEKEKNIYKLSVELNQNA